MSEILSEYEVFDPGVYGPWKDLPRAEARKAIKRILSERERRIEQLLALVGRSGIQLPGPQAASDVDIEKLCQWFFANMEPDPYSPARLIPPWYSVVSDVGLYLGEIIIARGHGLEWRMYTADRGSRSYQELVIMGFPVANRNYFVNPGFSVADWVSSRLNGEYIPDRPMVEMVRLAIATSDPEDN